MAMRVFSVSVADPASGETTTLSVTARTPSEAASLAHAQGWLVSSVDGVSATAIFEDASRPVTPVHIASEAKDESQLLTRPISTIAMGVFCGQILVAGLVMLMLMLAGALGGGE